MLNPMDLNGKRIMVTGASSGIGKEIAVFLSRLGANVVMAARSQERLKEAINLLEPGKHSFHVYDMQNLGGIAGLIDDICAKEGKLDGLVHSAGISKTVPLQYLKTDDLYSIMAVNFFAFVELAKGFSKRKNNNDGGSIVAISSISSSVGAKGLTAYCASKGALDSSIRAMALDLAPKKIRINSVAPGMIATQIYEGLKGLVDGQELETGLMKRQMLGIGKPEDVAHAAAFLLSDAARFITGTSMVVDGGYLAH